MNIPMGGSLEEPKKEPIVNPSVRLDAKKEGKKSKDKKDKKCCWESHDEKSYQYIALLIPS